MHQLGLCTVGCLGWEYRCQTPCDLPPCPKTLAQLHRCSSYLCRKGWPRWVFPILDSLWKQILYLNYSMSLFFL